MKEIGQVGRQCAEVKMDGNMHTCLTSFFLPCVFKSTFAFLRYTFKAHEQMQGGGYYIYAA